MKIATKAEAGIKSSSEHSGEKWKDQAILFVYCHLMHNETLFCDDLWNSGLKRPASPRALGAVMRHALQLNWISEQTSGGNIMAKRSESSNGQLKRVWRSNLYKTKLK